MDGIIFGSTNQDFCEMFGDMIEIVFEMSMIGEFSLFLGLQFKQLNHGTFVSQGNLKDMPQKFNIEDEKYHYNSYGH